MKGRVEYKYNTTSHEEDGVCVKHDKSGVSVYVNIYNTNNLANEGGNAGLKQDAENGGQISGAAGENANQGGQIAAKCGQNANQEGQVESQGCGSTSDE